MTVRRTRFLGSIAAFFCLGSVSVANAQGEPQLTAPSTSSTPSSCQLTHVSSFWSSLEQLCAHGETLSRANAPSPDVQQALQAVRAYCGGSDRPVPPFSALREAERQKLLLRVARATGVELTQADPQRLAEPVGSWLLDDAAKRWLPDARLQTGALVASLVRETVGQLCEDPETRRWLSNSCTPLPATHPLVELRQRMVLDAVQLPRRAWAQAARPVPPGIDVALQLLEALERGLDVERILGALAEPSALAESLERCATDAARASRETAKRRAIEVALTEARQRAEQAREEARLAEEQLDLAERQARAAVEQVQAAEADAQVAAQEEQRRAEESLAAATRARAEAEARLGDVEREVQRLARDLEAFLDSAQVATPPQVALVGQPPNIALELVRRLLADGHGFAREPLHYRRVVLDVLDRAKLPPEPGHEKVIDELVSNLKVLRQAQQALLANPNDLTAFRRGANALLLAIERSRRLAGADATPPVAHDFALAVIDGNVDKALSTALVLTARATNQPLPDAIEEVVQCASGVLRARDDSARKSALLACTVLPPWTQPFIFDANVGALSVAQGDTRLAGDATLGYNGLGWGVVGRGYGAAYTLETEDSLESGGSLDVWLATQSPKSPWRFEGRFAGGGDLHDATSVERTSAGTVVLDEDSILLRGLVLLGLRHQTARSAVGVWAGAGPQYEIYSPDVFSTSRARGVVLTTEEHLAVRYSSRLRAELHLWQGYLTTRLRVDADAYDITRESEVVSVLDGMNVVTTGEADRARQLEVFARWFLDLEAARVFDFVPGAALGFNYLFRSQGGQVESAFLPIATIGLRREVF